MSQDHSVVPTPSSFGSNRRLAVPLSQVVARPFPSKTVYGRLPPNGEDRGRPGVGFQFANSGRSATVAKAVSALWSVVLSNLLDTTAPSLRALFHVERCDPAPDSLRHGT
jgi:hypothetical protein